MADTNKIMVVDDDPDCSSMVQTILESRGFETIICGGGLEAIEKIKSGLIPSLILLDIMMPDISGYDVLIRLKQQPETQSIPVIFLSAKGDPEDLLVGYKDYGVEYYITKPFTTRQLLAGVKLTLGLE